MAGDERTKDGQSWQIGTAADVSWIVAGTSITRRITSAIPAVFEAYATFDVVDPNDDRGAHDRAVLALLTEQSGDQPWWLGYLDTGADDIVFADAPMVRLYADWPYVLVEAGPTQAAGWRSNDGALSWRGALPDLIFPADRSWLLSWLWDDDWRCLGGPVELVDRFRRDEQLRARPVGLDEDATPPGSESH